MSKFFNETNYKPVPKVTPPIMLIYGEVGIGKSTFCSSFPNAFFFDFEDRTGHIAGIGRDTDFNVGLKSIKSWGHFLEVVVDLKETNYDTIVFDGISKLQSLIWKEAGRILNNPNPKDIKFGRGYGAAYDIFEQLIQVVKDLCYCYKKTIIFVDHEKIKEEDAINSTAHKFAPECMNGLFKMLLKESHYVFRLVEDFTTHTNNKTGEIINNFNNLILLTDRKTNPECFLKTSLHLPPKIKANYHDFKQAVTAAHNKIKSFEEKIEKITIELNEPDKEILNGLA